MMHSKCRGTYMPLLAVMLLVALVGCKPKRPSGILSPSVMEELLVDYHLAQGMAETASGGRSSDEMRYLYIHAALKKHNIDEAVFDSSMVYYSANSEQMAIICQHVCDKIEARGGNIGTGDAGNGTTSKYAGLTALGDTANVWTGLRHATLTPDRLHNLLVLNWPADSTTRPGDTFIWHCNTQKVAQSNLPDVYVQLIIRFDNDTVTSVTSHMYGDRETEVYWKPTAAMDSLRPASVTAMVYMTTREQTASKESAKTQAEALLLSDISLIRIHKQKVEAPQRADTMEVRKDTVEADTATPKEHAPEVSRPRLTPAQLRDAHPHPTPIQQRKNANTAPTAPTQGTPRPRRMIGK